MRTTKKLGLAAAVVVALLVGMAAPAAATRPVRVTSGTLVTVLGSFDLTPGSQGTPPCPEKPSTLAFTTNPNNTWTLQGTFSGQFQLPPGSGNWYQADFTIQPGSGGNWNGPPPTQNLTGIIAIQVVITQITVFGSPIDCSKTNIRCRITGLFNVVPPSTYKSLGAGGSGPGLPATVPGDLVTIWANTAVPLQVKAPCAPPWTAVGGTNAQIVNLQATLV